MISPFCPHPSASLPRAPQANHRRVRIPRVLAAALASAGLAGALSAQTVHTMLPEPGEYGLGAAVGVLGDLNGDGYPEFLVGAPSFASPSGAMRIVDGQTGDTRVTLPGYDPLGDFGNALCGVGDVDHDGAPDFLVADRSDDKNGKDAGSVRVFSGSTYEVLFKVQGDTLDRLGWAVAAAGDVDLDGFVDFVIGAPYDDPNGKRSGTAKVYSGKDKTHLYDFEGEHADDRLGTAVAGGFDFDQDGFSDIVAGAPLSSTAGEFAGSAYLYSGKKGDALAVFHGSGPGPHYGSELANGGDVDGDSVDDLLVGNASDFPNQGQVDVRSGATGMVIHLLSGADGFGRAVSPAGDVDGDGRMDIAVASPYATVAGQPNAGRVQVFAGIDGAPLIELYGDAKNQRLGTDLVGGFDANQDGVPDLLAGAPWNVDYAAPGGTGLARVLSTGCGDLVEYGAPCLSALLSPRLVVTGCPVQGGALTIRLETGASVAVAALVFASPQQASTSIGGDCTLQLAPSIMVPVIQALVTGVDGEPGTVTLAPTLPVGPAGTIVLQAAFQDAAAPLGFVLSGGVGITIH